MYIYILYTQDKVVGSVGAAPVWVSAALSQRVNTLPDICAPLFKRQGRWSERRGADEAVCL